MNKYLSFGVKIAKIGPVDPEIIRLQAIIKKRKKLTQAKYIIRSASLPSRLKIRVKYVTFYTHFSSKIKSDSYIRNNYIWTNPRLYHRT